ncbi:PREDICTED: uncharacterized protein LOC107070705 [Polistes dominula]|uniref:Uncharacterized protein LOC107070705 n=1 Tax=Polistes dominula TaxID=743375 RepID=A0ABM1IWP1_POLDO|nr:PREDICTED: uncharacterized protein LOC107070705 [Polistes dominula]
MWHWPAAFREVEGAATFIVSRRALKIPPIFETQTTSNISFEEGGANNVPKPCSRLPQPSSVSRGVRSRPLEEEVVTLTKVETIPLLSPTMESDLLKEPWIFPQTKTNILMEEDSVTTFPEWEENFQDLSGWCMDQFQTPCDFPIGELVPFKLSGTKYEGKSVSNLGKGVSENATKGINEDKGRLKMNLFDETEIPGDKYQPLLPSSNSSFSYKKQLDEAEYKESNNTLLKLPKACTSASNSKMNTSSNVNVSSFHSQQRIDDLDLDDACQNTFESTENNQSETWDMLNTVQTSGSGTFDLLSYLYEDEPYSPGGGSTSTDTSTIFNSRSPIEQLPSVSQNNTEKAVKVDMEVDKVRRKTRSTTSTITSSSDTTATTFSVTSRRSERTRTITNTNKVEKKKYSNVKREKRKLSIDDSSSSDSRVVDHFNYRESREKNNEASRKSRMNKKAKETEMAIRALELEKDNKILKMKVEELEKLVISMRNALLQSALKKEN